MNDTLKTIGGLRSVHGNFSARAIEDADVETIIGAAVRAANASARQSYSMIVLDDKEAMRELTGYTGARMIVFCVDYSRIEATSVRLGHGPFPVDLTEFVNGAMDTSFAAQTAVIAAKSLGIDSLLTNGLHRAKLDRVYEILGLPERLCFPLIALALGYPAEEPHGLKGRLRGAGVVHYGRFRPITDEQADSLIAEYDDESRNLGLNPGWKQQGFDHYLDWFYTKWSGKTPVDKQRELADRLRRCGFLDVE